ncbi:hypothetical protein ElyMa_006014100 [Elysia marginata]|uniref:Uncharacterized protein n=1 Tax=Elysia marginata TaxID=1093978 RepID=A0AAV4GIM4_9GAST|nr:hypothetical protein ElyMa_006014100 [Elysia marginata]
MTSTDKMFHLRIKELKMLEKKLRIQEYNSDLGIEPHPIVCSSRDATIRDNERKHNLPTPSQKTTKQTTKTEQLLEFLKLKIRACTAKCC